MRPPPCAQLIPSTAARPRTGPKDKRRFTAPATSAPPRRRPHQTCKQCPNCQRAPSDYKYRIRSKVQVIREIFPNPCSIPKSHTVQANRPRAATPSFKARYHRGSGQCSPSPWGHWYLHKSRTDRRQCLRTRQRLNGRLDLRAYSSRSKTRPRAGNCRRAYHSTYTPRVCTKRRRP